MKVADSKREEFRKYLEKAGVLDALTKGKFEQFWRCFACYFGRFLSYYMIVFIAVLVNLYEEPEKPSNALEYPLKDIR